MISLSSLLQSDGAASDWGVASEGRGPVVKRRSRSDITERAWQSSPDVRSNRLSIVSLKDDDEASSGPESYCILRSERPGRTSDPRGRRISTTVLEHLKLEGKRRK